MEAPPVGRTLCEVNANLVTVAPGATRLTAPACPDVWAAGGVLAAEGAQPVVLVQCPSGRYPPAYNADEGTWNSGSSNGSSALQRLLAALPLPAAFGRALGGGAPAALPPKPLAWHLQQPLLAVVAEGEEGVRVYDYSARMPQLGRLEVEPPPALAPKLLMRHEFQHKVCSAAWRPNAGSTLAVGCEHGVCLWSLARGAGGAAKSEGSLTWLSAPSVGPVVALAWHPQGHLLAGASANAAGLCVWDVATGSCTPVRAGLEAVVLLRWSPCGSYLLAAHPGGDFCVWETSRWRSQRWAAEAPGGRAPCGGGEQHGLVDAQWGPDGRSLLLAYRGSAQMVSLHFTAEPPSLQAQLLPLALPELSARANGSTTAGCPAVQAVAWDPTGQRLAVALGGDGPAAGSVALYDTRCDPIVSARFIGFARAGPMAPNPAAATEHDLIAGGSGSGGGQQVQQQEQQLLAFAPSFHQGALLAVRSGSHVAALPLFFAA